MNLPTKALCQAVNLSGVHSSRNTDKFALCQLTLYSSLKVICSQLAQSPVALGCRVLQIFPMGSHNMFLADVIGVSVDPQYLDE